MVPGGHVGKSWVAHGSPGSQWGHCRGQTRDNESGRGWADAVEKWGATMTLKCLCLSSAPVHHEAFSSFKGVGVLLFR